MSTLLHVYSSNSLQHCFRKKELDAMPSFTRAVFSKILFLFYDKFYDKYFVQSDTIKTKHLNYLVATAEAIKSEPEKGERNPLNVK